MKTHQCVQYSPEWWAVRAGKATASEFDRILSPTGKVSAQRFKYAARLAAEALYGCHPNWFTERPCNPAMRHGLDYEPEARRWYALETDADVRLVGFCESDCGRYGSSPDGLVGAEGVLELKCPQPETHAEYLLDPADLEQAYRPQCHGHLLVTGRPWVDLVSYCPPMPGLVRRVVPGEYTARLAEELAAFLALVAEATLKLKEGGA